MDSKKFKGIILALLATIFSLNSLFAVQLIVNEGDLVDFKKVEINGVTVLLDNGSNNNLITKTYVYPGEKVNVLLIYKGVTNEENIRVVGSIPGYRYSLIKTISGNLEVVNDTTKTISFYLDIPKDIEEGEYPLRIEFIGKSNSDYIEIPIIIEKPPKYLLDIDVDVFPKLLRYSFNCVKCAENKYEVLVRIENKGKDTLKHVNIEAYLKEYPEITKTKVYLYKNRDDMFDGQLGPGEVATLKAYIDLNKIPIELKTGTYHVVVKVRYDYNHLSITKEIPVQLFNIDAIKKEEEKEEKPEKVVAKPSSIEVTIDPADILVFKNPDEEKEYTLKIKNKENARINLNIEVETVPQVNFEIIPQSISLQPLGQEEVKIKLKVNEEGTFPVIIKILNEEGKELKIIKTNVEGQFNNTQPIVIAIIIILIVLIIAVLIALILKKKSDIIEKEKIIVEKEKGPNIKVEEDELY